MKIGPLQAFGIGFALAFIFSFALGLSLGLLFGSLGAGLAIGLVLGILSGVAGGTGAVILFFIVRLLTRNQAFVLAGILLVVALVFYPPASAIALVVFLLSFLGVKKGR